MRYTNRRILLQCYCYCYYYYYYLYGDWRHVATGCAALANAFNGE